MLRHPRILGGPQQRGRNQKSKPMPGVTMIHHQQSVDSKIVPVSSIAPEGWGPKEGGNATSPVHSRGFPKRRRNQKSKPTPGVTIMYHATKRGFKVCPGSSIAPEGWGPKEGGNATSPLHSRGSPKRRRNQKSKPTPGVTMMHHATKRGFKDCPGFLNSTGRLGPKRGWKCHVTPAFSGSPTKGTNSEVKTYAGGHHDAPPTKRGFKDFPGFLNSTGRLGPKGGRKCYVTGAFSGVPKKGMKSEVKTYAGGHHDAPRNKA